MAFLSKHDVCSTNNESADVNIVEDITALETEIRVTHNALKEEQVVAEELTTQMGQLLKSDYDYSKISTGLAVSTRG